MKLSTRQQLDLNELIQKNADRFSYFGDVSLYHDKDLLFQQTYGYSNIQDQIPFTKDTKLSIYLLNRTLASIAILLLVEEKKLNLNDLVSNYIKEYKHGHLIKILDLLQYTSQIPDYVTQSTMLEITKDEAYETLSEMDKKRVHFNELSKNYSFNEVLDMINDMDLLRKPGGTFEYNLSTTLVFLKEIIERVANQSYDKFVIDCIIYPSGVQLNYGNFSDAKYYEQTHEDYHFEFSISEETKTIITLSVEEAQKLMLSIVKQDVIHSKIWKLMHKVKEDVGIGLFKYNGYVELSISCMSHRITCCYYEALDLSLIFSSNYEGNWLLESGTWHSFMAETHKLISSVYMYPSNLTVEKYSTKNRFDFYEIEITDIQKRYVPDVFKCLAYTYNMSKYTNYVVKDYGQSVGMFTLLVNKTYGEYEIKAIMVDYKYQNRGYGKLMLIQAVDLLKKQGASILEIGLVPENTAALKMYQSIGFKPFSMSAHFIVLRMIL
ncbi:MAG: GNAT family N-acetyltransferase [Acholeplasmataceae bacterium]|jgi:ribosomal protein S18 acetylase RimI-like enzyme|nr:GNAT family N-acetyltransferase [Acholeplasmataceae bacterium]